MKHIWVLLGNERAVGYFADRAAFTSHVKRTEGIEAYWHVMRQVIEQGSYSTRYEVTLNPKSEFTFILQREEVIV